MIKLARVQISALLVSKAHLGTLYGVAYLDGDVLCPRGSCLKTRAKKRTKYNSTSCELGWKAK